MPLSDLLELDDDLDPDFLVPIIMSAAGTCKSFDAGQLRPFAEAADVAVAGSFTLRERLGNTGPRKEYVEDPRATINAWGLPNRGSSNIPVAPFRNLIASIQGETAEEFWELHELHDGWGVATEWNLACPNKAGGNMFAFDPNATDRLLEGLSSESTCMVGLKLSIYSEPNRLKEMADVISRHAGKIDYVAACNTFAGGRMYRPDGSSALKTNELGVRGGIGGEALKFFSLSNAADLRELLPGNIEVLRVGGVSSGRDVWESMDVGCAGVQIHSAISQQGIGVIQKIREEYVDLYRS